MKTNVLFRLAIVHVCVFLFCSPLASCGNKSNDAKQNQSEVVVTETEKTSETKEMKQNQSKEGSLLQKEQEEDATKKLICTHTLYQEPYLIFQAGLSSKPSDFYLTAYNTSTGTIEPLNKGFHRQYFIRNKELYFSQHGNYYKCSLEELNDITTIKEEEFDSKLFNDIERLEYAESVSSLPDDFKKLDYLYINQLLKGFFTDANQEETLFLTGDEQLSSVGIIQKVGEWYVPSIRGEFVFPEKEVYPLWQSMVIDIDKDGLDEVVVIGHDYDYHTNPTMVFVWDYNVINKSIEHFVVGNLTKVSDPELIEKNREVYLQYSFAGEEYKLKIDHNPKSEDLYSLVKTEESLTPVIFSHKPAAYFPSFSILENFDHSSALSLLSTEPVEQFSCVSLPPKLSILPDNSSEEEKQFIRKQNQYLAEFISKLNKGIDPFKQTPKNPCPGMRDLTQMETMCKHSSLTFVDYIQYKITRVESIFPITANNNEYIVITAKGGWDTYVFLFNPSFELLDIYWEQGSCSEGNINTIVSLEKQSYFWISTYAYRGPYLLRYFEVENEKLVDYEWYCTPGMVRKNGKVYFEYSDGYMYKETKGCDSGMTASEYVDPFTHETCNKEFLAEMVEQYDSTYVYYFCLRHKEEIFDGSKIVGELNNDIPDRHAKLPNGRNKYEELSWFFRSFEQFEIEITNY